MATLCLSCLVRKDAMESDGGKMKLNDLPLSLNMGDMWFIIVTSSECSNTERRSRFEAYQSHSHKEEEKIRKLVKTLNDMKGSFPENLVFALFDAAM